MQLYYLKARRKTPLLYGNSVVYTRIAKQKDACFYPDARTCSFLNSELAYITRILIGSHLYDLLEDRRTLDLIFVTHTTNVQTKCYRLFSVTQRPVLVKINRNALTRFISLLHIY